MAQREHGNNLFFFSHRFDVGNNRKASSRARVCWEERKMFPVNFVAPLKTSFSWICSRSAPSQAVIEIGCVSLADSGDLNDPCAAYKKQRRNVTKQTGQCLTLSSVRPDLLSCCCCCCFIILFFLSLLLGQILTCRRSFNCSNKPTGA